jgi:hypothetical protein
MRKAGSIFTAKNRGGETVYKVEVSRTVESLRSISHPTNRVELAIANGADSLAAGRFGTETAQYLVIARQNLGAGLCPGF